MEKTAKLSLAALALVAWCGFSAAPAEAQYSQSYKLMKAINDGDYYAGKAAILNGAQVNGRTDHGVPYLCLAADKGDSGMVYILLDQGANPNLARPDGETALMIAAEHGYIDMASTLLAQKADPDITDRNGETALIKAARIGNRDIVTKLIDAKADLNHQDYTGKSALSYALDNRRTRVADDLKKAGATE
jgi:uncharacterized protein